jgi:hypothetical protein
MDQTTNRFAYRCLPLSIANAHGWMILNSAPFVATWNGGAGIDAVSIQPSDGVAPLLATSHFGGGILTFHVNALFRTEPGYDLVVAGPINQPKDAIQPLTGIVETDWAPFTFTMNWKFTRKGTRITFERDEPFCMIFPVRRGLVEECDPEVRALQDDKDVFEAYTEFHKRRGEFLESLKVPGSEAQAQGWEKHYFRGTTGFEGKSSPDHRTKIKAKDFK